jgi:hypothetical protein
MHKLFKAAAVTLALAGFVAVPASATSPEPTTSAAAVTYATLPLPTNSVGAGQLSPNSVGYLDFGSDARREWQAMKSQAAAASAKATQALAVANAAADLNGEAKQLLPFNPVTIEHIGGKFLERYTHAGDFTLPSGRWNVVAVAKFTRNADAAAGDPAVRPMVGLRVGQDAENNNFGISLGSIGGNDIAPFKGADLWGSSGGVVVDAGAGTVVDVNVFGYNDKRGSEGSGQIDVQVTVYVFAA